MSTPVTVAQLLAQLARDTHVVNLPSNFKRSEGQAHTIGNPGGSSAGGGGNFWSKIPHPGKGAFHTVVDYMSRPGSAVSGYVAENVDNFKHGRTDKDAIFDALGPIIMPGVGAALNEGVRRSFTGKEHHNFKEVLGEVGYTGKGAGSLGLGLDLVTDPLMYAGGVGALSKGTKSLEGLTALEKAITAGKNTAKVAGNATGVSDLGRAGRAVAKKVSGKSTAAKVSQAAVVADEQYKAAQALTHATSQAHKEIDALLASTGKARALPPVATPTAASISDITKPAKGIRYTSDELDELKRLAQERQSVMGVLNRQIEGVEGHDYKATLASIDEALTKLHKSAADFQNGTLPKSYFHGTSTERAQGIEKEGSFKGLNITHDRKTADDYAGIGERHLGGGVTLEGYLVGEGHHKMPWGYVTAEAKTFVPVRKHFPDGRVEDLTTAEAKAYLAKQPKLTKAEKEAAEVKPKTFDEIKSSLTKADKDRIITRARQLSKEEFDLHDLSKLDVAKGGFKDFTYDEIIKDKVLAKSLFEHPDFAPFHKESLDLAKGEFMAKFNEKAALKAAKTVGAIEKVETRPEAAADAIAKGDVIEPKPLAERVHETSTALSETEREIALAYAAKHHTIINDIHDGKLSSAAQVNLRNAISTELRKALQKGKTPVNAGGKRIQEAITRTYAHAEALLEHSGLKPIINPEHLNSAGRAVPADLTPLRLSTILPHLSATEIKDGEYLTQVMMGNGGTELARAIRDAAFAGAHLEDARKLEPILKQLADTYHAAMESDSIKATVELAQDAKATARETAQEADVSATGVKTAENSAKAAVEDLKASDPLVEVNIQQAAHLDDATRGAGDPDAIGKMVKAASVAADRKLGIQILGKPILLSTGKGQEKFKAALGLKRGDKGFLTPAQDAELGRLGKWAAASDRHFQTMFNNALGFKDLQGIRNGARNAGIGYTADAQRVISELFRGVSKEDSQLAFRMAQTGDFAGPQGQLAQTIAARMENLYGENGILRRGLVTSDDYQKYLHKSFYGKDQRPKLPFAEEHDAAVAGLKTQVAHPYDSWKTWKMPEGKYAHAGRFMLAQEDAAHKALAYNIAEREVMHGFGLPIPFKDSVAIGKYHYPSDIAPQVQNMLDSFNVVGKGGGQFLQSYDKFLHWMRVGFTKYFPAHHINNSIGQFLIAFNDGLTNPSWYKKSFQVLKGREAEVDPLNHLTTAPGKVIMQWKGQDLTAAQIYELGARTGIRQSHAIADDVDQEVKAMGRLSQGVQNMSNARENFHRYGHFMYALSKSKAATLEEAAREAATRVNTMHGDYNDLTLFERKVAKRLIPFYTWQRKVGPIIFKQMMTNPGRTMAYPRLMSTVGGYDENTGEGGELFPNQMGLVPSYMSDLLQVPMGSMGGNPLFGGPRSPFGDIVGANLNDPIGNQLNSISPAIKLPVEFATRNDQGGGNSFGKGIPYTDFKAHAEDSLPYISVLKRLTRRDPLNGFESTKDAEKYPDEQGPNLTAILNILTGASVQELTESRRRFAEKEAKSAAK